ncbi:MAG: ATP-binding protein [Bacilli bacterium]|jgi:predicted AAA+ superfamily ATPase
MKYFPRIIDKTIKEELEAFGAVLIVGPKWCGKTTSAEQLAKSKIYLQDEDMRDQYLQTADIMPSRLLVGENPRLIDEWQDAPKLWGAIRYDIDKRNQEGLYILTGSVTVDDDSIIHSGTGRISRVNMRTMTLYEQGKSTGDISFLNLFGNEKVDINSESKLSIDDLSVAIVTGGWPKSLGKSESIALKQIAGYSESIIKTEIKLIDGTERDENKAYAILRSLARNTASQATNTKILADVTSKYENMHLNTLVDYIKTFKKIFVIEDLPAWSPFLRSKTTIRVSDTRHFVDPAIAAYFLGATSEDLKNDWKTFGNLFESLVIRDLRVYAQANNGKVYHYRDKNELEVDAIIHLNNGKWGAVEIKLGSSDIDKAALNLLKLKEKIDIDKMREPSFLMVVTGTKYAYKRDDGVLVVPIGCLKD